jgi:hypothetical protein
MFGKLQDKLLRFLSIVGGFSSPEDIARAKRRRAPEEADKSENAGGSSSNLSSRDEKGDIQGVK